MNALEIISLIAAVAVLLKLLVFLVKPKFLKDWGNAIAKKGTFMLWYVIILLVVIAYFVFSAFTITQALPVILLGYMLLALMLVQYPKVYQLFVKEVFKDTGKTWLIWAIWTVLSVWALYVLFV